MAAVLMTFDHNPGAAEREWKLALEIDPNYAHAWHQLFLFYDLVFPGDTNKALAALRQAERLEPLSPAIACDFGFSSTFRGGTRKPSTRPGERWTCIPLFRPHVCSACEGSCRPTALR
jgi:hypothetical protein